MKATPPTAPIRQSLPGPEDITRVQLPNGIIVLARPNFNSPSVVINGYAQAGSLFDPAGKLGLADFTASALMRGTRSHSFQQIYNALESAGANLGIGGGTHTAGFSGRALAEDLDLLLNLLAESLRYPTFPEDHVERLRSQLLTRLAIRAQDTGEMASMAFDQIVYQDHPYSLPEDGYPETVAAIQLPDLVEYHRQYYGPLGMVVAIVGAVEPGLALDKVTQVLGDWENPRRPKPPELPPLKPVEQMTTRRVKLPGKSQADLVMGAAGPQRSSPDFLAASLGNDVLGQFGMYGRIGKVVREQAGLAYYAYSNLSGGIGPGPWCVTAGVAPGDVEKAVDLVRSEITRFVHTPVSETELEDSKASFIGRLPLSLETNAGVAAALLNLERYTLGLDYYYNYPSLIRAITPQEVLEVAQHYLDPDRLGIGVAGSFDNLEPAQSAGNPKED